MAFQMGFPKKLNVPTRKIQNKTMGDINFSATKGRMGIDTADYSMKQEIGRTTNGRKATGVKRYSPDIAC